MKRILNVFVLGCLTIAFGCGGDAQVSVSTRVGSNEAAIEPVGHEALPSNAFVAEEDANDIHVNGWKIVYPKSLKKMKLSMVNDQLTIAFAEFEFKVRDNAVFVGENNYGMATAGDTVQIGLNGEIAVNGEIREPVAEE